MQGPCCSALFNIVIPDFGHVLRIMRRMLVESAKKLWVISLPQKKHWKNPRDEMLELAGSKIFRRLWQCNKSEFPEKHLLVSFIFKKVEVGGDLWVVGCLCQRPCENATMDFIIWKARIQGKSYLKYLRRCSFLIKF